MTYLQKLKSFAVAHPYMSATYASIALWLCFGVYFAQEIEHPLHLLRGLLVAAFPMCIFGQIFFYIAIFVDHRAQHKAKWGERKGIYSRSGKFLPFD